MPSISACQLTQLGQSMPPGWGRPHLGQRGDTTRGNELRQEGQIKSPPRPQPKHRRGNKKSSAFPPSLTTWGNTLTTYNQDYTLYRRIFLTSATIMQGSTHNGLVNIDVPVPDFQIKATFRISADPCFVMNICSLATEIGQGHEVSGFALLTFGESCLFHGVHLPT